MIKIILAIYILGIVIALAWLYAINKGTITPKRLLVILAWGLLSWISVAIAVVFNVASWWRKNKDKVIL